jgi:hypothetical protein
MNGVQTDHISNLIILVFLSIKLKFVVVKCLKFFLSLITRGHFFNLKELGLRPPKNKKANKQERFLEEGHHFDYIVKIETVPINSNFT